MDPITTAKVIETAQKVYETTKKIEKVVNVSKEMKSVAESEGKDQIDASTKLASEGKILVGNEVGKTEGKAKLDGNVPLNNKIFSLSKENTSLINGPDTGGIGERVNLWGEGIPTKRVFNDGDNDVFYPKFPEKGGHLISEQTGLAEAKPSDTFDDIVKKSEPGATEDAPCRIKTINDSLEGQKHPETGVPYERKVVETDTGELVEGVFPQFESILDVQLPEALEQATDKKQFDECNRQLKERCKSDPEFRSKFTPDQLADIEDGYTPEGFTWHHNEVKGKMQLVDTDIHWETRHTGGRNIWGGGTDNRR